MKNLKLNDKDLNTIIEALNDMRWRLRAELNNIKRDEDMVIKLEDEIDYIKNLMELLEEKYL